MTLDNYRPGLSAKQRAEKEKLVEELTAKCIKKKVGLERMMIAKERIQGELAGMQHDLSVLKQQLRA